MKYLSVVSGHRNFVQDISLAILKQWNDFQYEFNYFTLLSDIFVDDHNDSKNVNAFLVENAQISILIEDKNKIWKYKRNAWFWSAPRINSQKFRHLHSNSYLSGKVGKLLNYSNLEMVCETFLYTQAYLHILKRWTLRNQLDLV